jgi:hypothetical protein
MAVRFVATRVACVKVSKSHAPATMPCAIASGEDGAFRLDGSTSYGPKPTTLRRMMNSAALM